MSEWNNETADWYASKYGNYATNRLGIESLNLNVNSVIVDVGCGTGSALRHASTYVTQGTLIGIDPVPRMIEIASEQTKSKPIGTNIEFRLGPAENLPVKDDSVDIVLAFDSYDHWKNKSKGLQEISRILRQDGKIVVLKDGHVPGAAKSKKTYSNEIKMAGFKLLEEQHITGDNVTFTISTFKKLA